MLRRMVDQPRRAGIPARVDAREGRAERIGVERIEQEDDQIAARIGERTRVLIDEAYVAALDVEPA
jgi:hypothetical protein